MIPKKWIEGYLRFLLNYRQPVTIVVALLTVFFLSSLRHMRLHTDFFDFYPRQHPYIQVYREFRNMFGSANVMTVILEVQQGDIYNVETMQKLDRITRYILETKGVIPYQVLSIAHPRMHSISTYAGGIQIKPIFYPGVPQTQEDLDRVKFSVYASRGVRGVYASEDDTAALVHAGFWEEAIDFNYLHDRMKQLRAQEEDANHKIYITGFPWLYASVMRYVPQVMMVFGITFAVLVLLLWNYFRTLTGIWVPVFSGILSSVWGLAFGALLGFNLDPLVLVLPIFLTARALSHSVQSMDRYHEEYYRLKDKHAAIVESYSHLFPPAIASIVTDGLGLLIVAVAPIPLIQKVAIFASFWVISIFISVVTLHPIILSWIKPPPPPDPTKVRLSDRIYRAIARFVIALSQGRRRYLMIGVTVFLFAICWSYGRTLKVADMTPGMALLFADHPYNVSWQKLNDKFLGASQLILIADTHKPDGLKNGDALTVIEEVADHMEAGEGAGASLTIIEIVKQLFRLYHEGEPRWSFVPDGARDIAQIFYVFSTQTRPEELDRFLDVSLRYATITTFFRGYSHDIIMHGINRAKDFARDAAGKVVDFKFAGGLFGVLAAVNEAVESSYWINLGLVFVTVFFCLFYTYGSPVAAFILLLPVGLAQVICEAVMVIWHVDLNVNSLPIAAAGAAVGVDYGIYHFSRMIDAYDEGRELDAAVDYATATTGKAIIFTATTMIAGTIFWWFSSLKFQAEMGLLLALLMTFNTFGGLVFVPSLVKVIKPNFMLKRRQQFPAVAKAAAAKGL